MGKVICLEQYRKMKQKREIDAMREKVRSIVDSIEKQEPEMYVTPNMLANLLYIVT